MATRGDQFEERTDAYRRLMYELFDAQREALIELRNQGAIGDEVRRRIERELDLEESRHRAPEAQAARADASRPR